MSDRFETFSNAEKELLFEALLHCIRTNSGIGFKSYDQGHPVYMEGAYDGSHDDADSPETNAFYQMYRELSLHMVDWPAVSAFRSVCATDWRQFCKLALHYHNERERDGTERVEGAAQEMNSPRRPKL